MLGTLLVAGGVVWLVAQIGWFDIEWTTGLAWLLGATGLGVLLLAASRHEADWLVGIGVILTIVLAAALTGPRVLRSGGVGERRIHPQTFSAVEETYQLGVGSLQLDLRDVRFPAGTTTVDVEVGTGELVIQLPDELSVTGSATVDVGELTVFGERHDGLSVDQVLDHRLPGVERVVELQLDVGMGSIEVLQ